MDVKTLAAQLDGGEYGKEMTAEQEAAAKAAGLVVVFGASDDLVEFRGAIHDEAGAYDGGTVRFDAHGIVPHYQDVEHRDEEVTRTWFRRDAGAAKIEALWAKEGEYSWTFSTPIPHTTFEIVEDGEPYCRGIVFALGDIHIST